jgi:diketogulonate reductase-like aldo/keto reductase
MDVVEANGARIPSLGFGTWTLKGAECARLVGEALAVGYRHLDTARMYENEAAVGDGLRASGVSRSEVFVTTKVWQTDIAPGDLERSAEASLKRLGLDQLDLILIHWPNAGIPMEGSIRALNAVRKAGIARHIGVSNFPTSLLSRALAVSDAPLACNQVEYHPYLDQTKLLDACRKNGIALVSYCPLERGGGLLSEKAVMAAATAHGKTPAQIVLRWHVQQDGVVAIPRTTKSARIAENAAIFDFALSAGEMAAISALKRPGARIVDNAAAHPPAWDD